MINERYKIIKKLGKGRSQVCMATDEENFGKILAIKILPLEADTDEAKHFTEEFAILKNLNHPNIVKAHDIGVAVSVTNNENEISVQQNSRYFTIDLIDGENIYDYCCDKSEDILLELVKQICHTLYYLHQSNFVYFDLKSENILVSDNNGKPFVHLLDFGLASNTNSTSFEAKRGTAEYLAPEILTDSKVDYRADFYSLGVLLYKIIYHKFPFEKKDQIELFRAHIENEPQFPSSDYSPAFKKVIKKLLSKSPADRFNSSLEIIGEFDLEIDYTYFKNWMPPKVFVVTPIVNSIINNYLIHEHTSELIVISGPEGSGKSKMVEELYYNFSPLILINYGMIESGKSIWEQMLKMIYYTDHVYKIIDDKIKSLSLKLLNGNSTNIISDLKAFYSQISTKADFILILDDFNLYDQLSITILHEIIPILLHNNIKIIITENSGFPLQTEKIHAKTLRELTPFTENQIKSYIVKTFNSDTETDKITDLTLQYSNSLPGAVFNFIAGLFFFEMLRYEDGILKVQPDIQRLKNIQNDNRHYSGARYSNLSDIEKTVAGILSALEINIKTHYLANIINISDKEAEQTINDLSAKGIIRHYEKSGFKFTSQDLKGFIYKQQKDKKQLHLMLANKLEQLDGHINRLEIARHFENAECYQEAAKIIYQEYNDETYRFAYKYRLGLLEKMNSFKLPSQLERKIRFDLIEMNFNLDDKLNSLKLLEEILPGEEDLSVVIKFLRIKISCLSALGRIEESRETIEEIKNINNGILDPETKLEQIIMEYEAGNYVEAETLINNLLSSKIDIQLESRLLNIKANISSNFKKEYSNAIELYNSAIEIHKKQNDQLRISKLMLNISVQYYLENNFEKAVSAWQQTERLNEEIGNLELNGLIDSNFGVYYSNLFNTDEAEKYFNKAESIFHLTGNKKRLGLVLHNHILLNIKKCEYSKISNQIDNCRKIFSNLSETNEMAELYFTEAKFYFETGEYKKLLFVHELYEELFASNQIPGYHKTNLELIRALVNYSQEQTISKDSVKKIIEVFFESRNVSDIIFCIDFLFNYLKDTDVELLNKYLSNEIIIKHCKQNYLDRYKLDYLNIQALQSQSDYPSALQILERNVNELQEKSISEITWKYLFKLSEEYLRRGNKDQAFEYIQLAKYLINFISDQFHIYQEKKYYLSEPYRLSTIEQIKTWENYFYAK